MNGWQKMILESRLTDIDNCTEPGHMTLEEALEFLEQLATGIQCRIDGIKDDMKSKD
jgi:hypothetical protein